MKLTPSLKFKTFAVPSERVELGQGAVVFVNKDQFGVVDYADAGTVYVFSRNTPYHFTTKWPYP